MNKIQAITATATLTAFSVLGSISALADTDKHHAHLADKAMTFAVPAAAYGFSPMGKIDDGSKALVKSLYFHHVFDFFKNHQSGKAPDQKLWDAFYKEVYQPSKRFIEGEITRLASEDIKLISSPAQVKKKMDKKLREWSLKSFYYYFNYPVPNDQPGDFSALSRTVVTNCLANYQSKGELEYYQNCFQPVSDLPGSSLPPTVPTDKLADVMFAHIEITEEQRDIPEQLAKSLIWYAMLGDKVLSHFEGATKDKSGFKDAMMDMFKHHSPESIAEAFRQHHVDLDIAYRKIWYYYDKFQAKKWYADQKIETF